MALFGTGTTRLVQHNTYHRVCLCQFKLSRVHQLLDLGPLDGWLLGGWLHRFGGWLSGTYCTTEMIRITHEKTRPYCLTFLLGLEAGGQDKRSRLSGPRDDNTSWASATCQKNRPQFPLNRMLGYIMFA